MYLTNVIGGIHLLCTQAYPYKPKRVITFLVKKFKVFLSFFNPPSSECCIIFVPCHIMRYWELNPNILSTFSGLSLSDGICVLQNFCLRLFPTLDILQKFQVRLFAFTWWYFDPVGISFNVMYYFHQRINLLTNYDCVVVIICNG